MSALTESFDFQRKGVVTERLRTAVLEKSKVEVPAWPHSGNFGDGSTRVFLVSVDSRISQYSLVYRLCNKHSAHYATAQPLLHACLRLIQWGLHPSRYPSSVPPLDLEPMASSLTLRPRQLQRSIVTVVD